VTTRTRPSDRRDQVIAAATNLFAEHGYQNVAFADVADAVDVTPSALYRHFKNKEQLFAEAVAASAVLFGAAAAGEVPVPAAAIAERIVAAMHAHRPQAILYLREAVYLQDRESGDARRVLDELTTAVLRERPDLSRAKAEFLVSASLGVLSGTIAHGTSAVGPRIRGLQTRMMTAVLYANLPDTAPSRRGTRPAGDLVRSRRETTLGAAVSLFRRSGYAGTAVDDIGAAAGITGPGVYRHFRSKQDLLVAAFRRTGDRFTTEATRAVGAATDPDDTLRRLIDSYVRVALADEDLLFVYIHEARNLPPDTRREMSNIQNELINTWIRVLRNGTDGLTAGNARTVTLAVIGIMNAAVITGSGATTVPQPDWISSVAWQAAQAGRHG
jgi:AcrR family transcriptional regulator